MAAAPVSVPTAGVAPMVRWHDPVMDGDEDEWTDDEALGYVQTVCSEEALLCALAAGSTIAGSAFGRHDWCPSRDIGSRPWDRLSFGMAKQSAAVVVHRLVFQASPLHLHGTLDEGERHR